MEQVLKEVLYKISEIDNELINNRKQKNKLIKSYEKKIKICNILNKLLNYKVLGIIIVILSLVLYLFFHNTILTIVISLVTISFFNLINISIINFLEPKEVYFDSIINFNEMKEELLAKRNTYINIYDYILKGDVAIINNIKLKINNKSSYDYSSYINSLWLVEDSFACNKINEMKNKEEHFVQDIKNKIYFELNSDIKKEGLSLEQLILIRDAL